MTTNKKPLTDEPNWREIAEKLAEALKIYADDNFNFSGSDLFDMTVEAKAALEFYRKSVDKI